MAEEPTDRTLDMRFEGNIDSMPAVIYTNTNELAARNLYISDECEAVFGLPVSAFMNDPMRWTNTVHPDDLERYLATWRDAFERQHRFSIDYRWIRPDGEVIWVRDESMLVRDEEGEPVIWQGVTLDITATKRTEDDLRASEARYRLLVENIPAVVYLVAPDDDRRTLYVSRAVESALGYERSEWLGQPDIWMELLHPDDREATLAAYDHHNETGEAWSLEYRLIASDGRAVWFRDVARLVRDETASTHHWIGVQIDITVLKQAELELRAARDDLEVRVRERTSALEEANELMSLEISERRRVEAELRETEHRYRVLAEQIPAVTYVWSIDHGQPADLKIYTSPRIEQMTGYSVEEWHRTNDFWISRIHPDDRKAVMAATMRMETTGEPFQIEYRYLHKDGHTIWVLDQAVVIGRDREGRPELLQGVMLDVTARHLAEASARDLEMRYRRLAESIPAVTYVFRPGWDERGAQLTYISPQITSMLGYSRDDVSDATAWFERIHDADRERVVTLSRHIAETGEPYVMEYRIRNAHGAYRWVRDQGAALARDAAGRPSEIQGLLVDITDTRLAERSLRDAEEAYRRLVEQIPAITYVEIPTSDPSESQLTFVSPQVERILGRTVDELIANPRHLIEMLHPEDRARVLAENAEADRTGEPFDSIYRIVRDDGRTVWLHSRATLVRDDHDRPMFWHGVALDVTAEHEMRESMRALEERYTRLARGLDDVGLN